MTIDVRIRGTAELRRVAEQIRREGRKDLSRELGRALSRASDPVKRAIKLSAEETMPDSGGYSATFTRSLRHRMKRATGANSARLVLTTYADGTGERRDIVALESGRLRHPVFGRSRAGSRKGERLANPWSVTKIRAGFYRRGTDDAMDESARQVVEVLDDLAKRLIR